MPLNLPDKLPAIELLKEENIFVIDNSRASAQDIRPLKIVILNLMPLKITTETDLVRLLSNTPLQLEISFMKLKSHTSKNTPVEHDTCPLEGFDSRRMKKLLKLPHGAGINMVIPCGIRDGNKGIWGERGRVPFDEIYHRI